MKSGILNTLYMHAQAMLHLIVPKIAGEWSSAAAILSRSVRMGTMSAALIATDRRDRTVNSCCDIRG